VRRNTAPAKVAAIIRLVRNVSAVREDHVQASPSEVTGISGAMVPLAGRKGDCDPETYRREPANDRGEPYDFASFIED
jgi:hypothetical protein